MKAIAYYKSPIGNIKLSATDNGLCQAIFTQDYQTLAISNPHLESCTIQLEQFFNKELKTFDLTFDVAEYSDFEQSVWEELRTIPYGETTTYGDLAVKLGKPKGAARAIGKAVGSNPITIINPCHRVVGANGNLTGFAWGLDKKHFLLKLENSSFFKGQQSLF